MIRQYKFLYHSGYAEADFIVDTDKLTADNAKILLEFFSWNYDEDADPIDELLKNYTLIAFSIMSGLNNTDADVYEYFSTTEGFMPLDGSKGIKLTHIDSYNLEKNLLDMTVKIL